jgi:phosphoribosylglycinamide formyltransferase-1
MKLLPRNRRLGILLSGRGSNFEAIAAAIDAGRLDAEIAVVISNIDGAPGLLRAQERGLKTVCIPSAGKPRERFDTELVDALRMSDVGLVVLAGFMRIFSSVFTEAFPNLILNIHPALLPAFPGLHVQQKALDYGVRFSGCTVHIVDGVLDGGPIVHQAVVPVMSGDSAETLSARILREEHRIYCEAIQWMLSGSCVLQGRRVICE